jgi:hypothetical protein
MPGVPDPPPVSVAQRRAEEITTDTNDRRALRRLEALMRAMTTEEDRAVVEGYIEAILMHQAVRRALRRGRRRKRAQGKTSKKPPSQR